MIASENSPLRNSPRVLSAKRFDRVEKMKRTVKLSLGFCIAMLTIALAAPHLSSPKLVLRFLPKDVYEAGKDHPAPSLPKRLLGHLLLVITAAYAVWAYRDISDGIRREKVSPAVRGADVPHHRKKGGIIMGDEQKYKTTISNVRWLAYDIPGNIGWKVFFKKEMAARIALMHTECRRKNR